MVGTSTCGTPAIGNTKYATSPSSVTPIVRRVVAIGRKMNGAETFIRSFPPISGMRFCSVRP